MAVLAEGQFMEVFLTPHNLGGGISSHVVAAGRSTLHLTDTLLGPRLKHLYFVFTYGSPYIYLPHDRGLLHKHLRFNWPTFFLLLRISLHAPNMRFCVDSAMIHLKHRTSGPLPCQTRSGNVIAGLLDLSVMSLKSVAKSLAKRLGQN